MASDRWRWLLACLALLVLAVGADAQGRKGKGGKGKGKGKSQSQWQAAPSGGKAPKTPFAPLPPLKGPKDPGEKEKKPEAKAPPPKPKPAAPPDPMKAADEVTAAADHRTALEKAQAELLRDHFRVCDLDSNDWLSLREADFTLSLDRGEYRSMDANQDGRLDQDEFSRQPTLMLARLGARPPAELPEPEPEPPAGPDLAPELSPETEAVATDAAAPVEPPAMPVTPGFLLERYDADHTGGMDAAEIGKLFTEAGLTLSAELVVAQLDPDDSGQLESGELMAVSWLASKHLPEEFWPVPEPPAALPQPVAVEAAPAVPAPPRRPTHFATLDPGNDGFIDEAELRALQSPARLDLRFTAVVSALDQDGDGRLSEAEFRASMSDERR